MRSARTFQSCSAPQRPPWRRCTTWTRPPLRPHLAAASARLRRRRRGCIWSTLRAHGARAGLSTPVIQAIARHLRENGQVLVYLNRRGYAPTLLCTACGWIAPCQSCDARMTVHLGAGRLRCHHCGADTKLPERCPQCGFAVKSVGQGTERIAESLSELFADTPLVRLDRDVVRRRGDMQSAVQRIASGEARILVGTQMVTKGHDFPDMTLVVVLNADQGLFSTDFRAARAAGSDHRAGGGPRGPRGTPRRGPDPNRVSRPSAASEPDPPRATTASHAPPSSSAPRRRGRRSAGSRQCATPRPRPKPRSIFFSRRAARRQGTSESNCSGRCRQPWRSGPAATTPSC